jgi:hypothetical protein
MPGTTLQYDIHSFELRQSLFYLRNQVKVHAVYPNPYADLFIQVLGNSLCSRILYRTRHTEGIAKGGVAEDNDEVKINAETNEIDLSACVNAMTFSIACAGEILQLLFLAERYAILALQIPTDTVLRKLYSNVAAVMIALSLNTKDVVAEARFTYTHFADIIAFHSASRARASSSK